MRAFLAFLLSAAVVAAPARAQPNCQTPPDGQDIPVVQPAPTDWQYPQAIVNLLIACAEGVTFPDPTFNDPCAFLESNQTPPYPAVPKAQWTSQGNSSTVKVTLTPVPGNHLYFGQFLGGEITCRDDGTELRILQTSDFRYTARVVYKDPQHRPGVDYVSGRSETPAFSVPVSAGPAAAYLTLYLWTPVTVPDGGSDPSPDPDGNGYGDGNEYFLLLGTDIRVSVDGVSEQDKTVRGAVVVKNDDGNKPHRKKITIHKVGVGDYNGKITLHWPGALQLFAGSQGGDPVPQDGTQNVFAQTDLPKDLWVEGAQASDTMSDQEISLDLDGQPRADFAKFTVVWAEKPALKFSGGVTIGDPVKGTDPYAATYEADSGGGALGPRRVFDALHARLRWGWAYEASALVHPSGFKSASGGPEMMLDRDAEAECYSNDRPSQPMITFSPTVPPGNDRTRHDVFPLVDPNDKGYLFDIDVPGLNPGPPYYCPPTARRRGDLIRDRMNAYEFCSYQVAPNVWDRCSQKTALTVRLAVTEGAGPDPQLTNILLLPAGDPGAVPNDNQACPGGFSPLDAKPTGGFPPCQ